MIELELHREGTVVPVKAMPGSAKPGVRGEHGGMLKLAIREAAEKGKANSSLIASLAELFGVAKGKIELLSGETSSHKRFLIRGVSLDAVSAAVLSALENASKRSS